MKAYTALYPESTGMNESPFTLHRQGCAAAKREQEKRGGSLEDFEAANNREAVEHVIDSELREMGYSPADIKVHYCCGRTPKSTAKEANTMAPAKTRTTRKAAKATEPAKETAEETPKADARRKHDDSALTEALVERVVNGDEKVAEVAKDLGIPAGKAAFLLMIHEADATPKLQIKVKTKDEAPDAITKARDEDLLSWGMIAARLRVNGERLSESTVKSMYQGNITKVTSARPKREAPAKATKATTTKTTTRRAPSKGKVIRPAPGAKRAKGTPDPS